MSCHTHVVPPAGPVATTPYYNPDTPPGVVIVSDVPAYTAANPHAFPIVSNHKRCISSFTILSLNTDSTIWNTDVEFLTLDNDLMPFHAATRFDWPCLPCLTCLLLPVTGSPQRPFYVCRGDNATRPRSVPSLHGFFTPPRWPIQSFARPGCIQFRRFFVHALACFFDDFFFLCTMYCTSHRIVFSTLNVVVCKPTPLLVIKFQFRTPIFINPVDTAKREYVA
jgi:hypothetical protein